jgi:hypothetical protein
MALQIRRGPTADRTGVVFLAGELVLDTDTNKLFVGDGSTAGGIQVDTTLSAQYLAVPSNITPDASNTRDIGTSSASWRTGFFQTVDASHIDAVSINGNIVNGDSTVVVNVGAGTVTADLTGNVIGNVTGDLTGNSTGTHKGTVNADNGDLRIDGASDRITNGVLDFDGSQINLLSGNGIQIGTNSSVQGVGLEIFNTDHTARNALRLYSDDGNANTFNSIEAYVSRGSIVTPTANAADDSLFGYIHYGHDGSQYVQSSFIVAGIDPQASVGAGAIPGNIVMGTTPDNGVTNNTVVINKDGNLGINTFTPTEKLDVDGNAQLTGSLLLGRFADASARDTAIPSPTAGMLVFITGTGKFQGNAFGGPTGWVDLN